MVAVAVVGVVFILSWIVRLWNEPVSQGWVVLMVALIGLSKIAVDALWPDSPTNHSGATGHVDESSWTCVQCGRTGEAVGVEDATRAYLTHRRVVHGAGR